MVNEIASATRPSERVIRAAQCELIYAPRFILCPTVYSLGRSLDNLVHEGRCERVHIHPVKVQAK